MILKSTRLSRLKSPRDRRARSYRVVVRLGNTTNKKCSLEWSAVIQNYSSHGLQESNLLCFVNNRPFTNPIKTISKPFSDSWTHWLLFLMAKKRFRVFKMEDYGDIVDPIDLTGLLLFRSVGAIFCLYRVVHPPFSFSLFSLEVQQAMFKNHNTESKSQRLRKPLLSVCQARGHCGIWNLDVSSKWTVGRVTSENYRGEQKGMQIWLSRTQARPSRAVKQEQEQNDRNHVQAFFNLWR